MLFTLSLLLTARIAMIVLACAAGSQRKAFSKTFAVATTVLIFMLFKRRGEHVMKSLLLPLSVLTALMVSGCAGTTPINNLPLPPVTTIEGSITQLDDNGFTLTDSSGSIVVKAKLPDGKKLNVSLDEKVIVYGNLQGGQEKVFDGYVVKKPSGEQIIVTNPTPHFGFILQSSFQ